MRVLARLNTCHGQKPYLCEVCGKIEEHSRWASSIGEGVDWAACLCTIKSREETNEKSHPLVKDGSFRLSSLLI